ncbi:coil containing protein [Vibrio phage 1.155.O._10N.222.55.B3]|nr:coil containing protein [Vibrio phage 1.155.O._10N.222.55.B3]
MKFMNLNKWLYSNPQDKSDDGSQGGGGGDQPLSFASQADLDAYVAGLQTPPATPPATPPKLSITEERQQQQEQANQQQAQAQRIEKAVVFNSSFDKFVADNKDYFPESTASIRKDVKTDDLLEKSKLIAATAAKEYFSISKNLESLTTTDRERVEREIVNVRYESDIDGLAVWELVERSLYGHQLANSHKKANDFMGKGGNGSTGYANVDKYLGNFFPESVVSVEN